MLNMPKISRTVLRFSLDIEYNWDIHKRIKKDSVSLSRISGFEIEQGEYEDVRRKRGDFNKASLL